MSTHKVDEGKMIASLSNQVGNQAIQIAERESLIEVIGSENKGLKDELKKVKEELKKRDDAE